MTLRALGSCGLQVWGLVVYFTGFECCGSGLPWRFPGFAAGCCLVVVWLGWLSWISLVFWVYCGMGLVLLVVCVVCLPHWFGGLALILVVCGDFGGG